MPDNAYTKREQDHFYNELKDAMERIESKQDKHFASVKIQLEYTNGKIKKIILALVLVFGIFLGMGATNFSALIKVFI